MSSCADHITEALIISDAMIQFVDRAEEECSLDGCLLLHGVIRDCAYKIRAAAERYQNEIQDRNEPQNDYQMP